MSQEARANVGALERAVAYAWQITGAKEELAALCARASEADALRAALERLLRYVDPGSLKVGQLMMRDAIDQANAALAERKP